jgi:hypothetical protein
MDRDRARVTAEAYGIRGRGWLRSGIRLLGIVAVLLGAYNLLLAPFLVTPELVTVYRDVAASLFVLPSPILADIALMAVGAVVAWFV